MDPPWHVRQLAGAGCHVRSILLVLGGLCRRVLMPLQSAPQIETVNYIGTLRLTILLGVFPLLPVRVLLLLAPGRPDGIVERVPIRRPSERMNLLISLGHR